MNPQEKKTLLAGLCLYLYAYMWVQKRITGQTHVRSSNPRSELTGSERYLGTDVEHPETATPVEPDKRLYAYDPIGNRQTATEGTSETAYEANSLNQYETVGGSSLIYDKDGNLTAYNGVNYEFNAENRLVGVEPASPVDDDTKVEFVYDYMGRRCKKTVSTYDDSIPEWTETSTTLFVYDGWNLIQELDASGTVQKSYAWGLDLSQNLQGAGGVGGLLAMTDGTDTFLYCYDGNGNVGQLVNAATGDIAAHYEYDPFGKTIVADETLTNANPFRFSTKFRDAETGLYYYGYRYYSTELGRWLSRDPLGEEGGLNLYSFLHNSSINTFDPLGLIDVSLIPNIMINNGWPVGAAILNRWLHSPEVGPIAPDTTTIKMDWVLSFPRAQKEFNRIFAEQIYRNQAAKKSLWDLIVKNNIQSGKVFDDLSKPILEIDKNYVNYVTVGSLSDSLHIDDLFAALGRFSFRIAVDVYVCSKGNSSAIVQYHRVGVYVKDSFDFEGFQLLGAWNSNTNYAGINPFKGDYVSNASFREYTKKTGFGRDFLIYSDLKVVDLQLPPESVTIP